MSGGPTRRGSLDAVRGVAIAVVLVYHVDPDVLPGGFVGIDLFFVLSGYLITALLLRDRARRGHVPLREFWQRRIRRLWPLSWTVLALVAIASIAHVWSADQQRALPGSTLAALLQVANWHQMNHGGYVESFAGPSPLQHYWSLSVEEQFYALWPPVLAGLLALRRRWVVPAAVGIGIVASVAASWWLVGDRAYLGTDTRAVGLLLGVLLAWVLQARPLEGFDGTARVVALVVGALASVVIGVLCVVVDITSVSDARIGFAALGLVSAAVVVGALNLSDEHPVVRPLAALGRISFAVYLVHWPLLVALGPSPSPIVRWVVGIPVSIAVAAVLHVVMEQRYIRRDDTPRLRFANATLLGLAIVALVVSVPTGQTPTERVRASLGTVADPTPNPSSNPSSGAPSSDASPGAPSSAAPTPEPGSPPSSAPATASTPTASTLPPCVDSGAAVPEFGNDSTFDPKTVATIPDPPSTPCSGQLVVLVLGDSTGRGVANGLASLHDPRLQVWDRTTLGCSLGGESCPDWRTTWAAALDAIHPDVVIMNHGLVNDFKNVDDPPFASPEGEAVRQDQLTAAVTMLQRTGATVFLVSPPTPIPPNALFYCKGKARGSACDPVWLDLWRASVSTVSARTGAQVLDVAGWAAARGSKLSDRPDGVHFTGSALRENARWLANEIVTRTPPRS